ncbi:hypothetical protein AQS70_09335 [Pseudomonas endophytica]|uniref:Uncharacterized protein n=1 Tax=Pseudomonas endophytica TaxID=1563157 RepID=A0A0Q0T377_9PSED|nr:hypothetical protein [Pseudomonas endophytica]KQB53803.1 hypothetical protein AQS70_09335 [Pseudomonas endophytica]
MWTRPSLDNKVISEQIHIAEKMLQVAHDELKNERVQMDSALDGEMRAVAFIEFLERTDERRSALSPFHSVRDSYLSAGFGGVQADELDRYREYLNYVISHARAKEDEVRRLEGLVTLLEKDISQLQAVEGYEFGVTLQYFGVKNMWWGETALCTLDHYGFIHQRLNTPITSE